MALVIAVGSGQIRPRIVISPATQAFLERCFKPDAGDRPSAQELLGDAVFKDFTPRPTPEATPALSKPRNGETAGFGLRPPLQ